MKRSRCQWKRVAQQGVGRWLLATVCVLWLWGCPRPQRPPTPKPNPISEGGDDQRRIPQPAAAQATTPRTGKLVWQRTAMVDKGAVFVGSARGHWLLRWSSDHVFVHQSSSGHLLHRVPIQQPVLAAALSPLGDRLCVLHEDAHPTKRLAGVIALSLGDSIDTLWHKRGIPLGLRGGLLATGGYCAALLPTVQAAMPKPFFYRAYGWRDGDRLFDSKPMFWQHRRPSAIEATADGHSLLALLDNGGAVGGTTRYLLEVITIADLSARISVSVDCGRLHDGTLLIRGGGLDQRHHNWLKNKSGFPVAHAAGNCKLPPRGSRAHAPSADRFLINQKNQGSWLVQASDGKRLRLLGYSERASSHPSPHHQHLRGQELLLADEHIVRIDLQSRQSSMVAAVPPAPSSPPYFGAQGTVVVKTRHGKGHMLWRYDAQGRLQEKTPLPQRARLLPKLDGTPYTFVPKKLPLRPRDAHWLEGEDGKARLLAYEPLSGVFIIDPIRGRLVKRCCRRKIGEGGIFGLSLAPNRKHAVVVFSGKKPTLRRLALPTLQETGQPIPLPHRRNDYASTVWLNDQEVAVLRDARFVGGQPTATVFRLQTGKAIARLRLHERGPVLWAAGRFYQLLEGGRGARLYGRDGKPQLTVRLVGGDTLFVEPKAGFRCSGRACAQLRCTLKGQSVPVTHCAYPSKGNLI